MMTGRRNAMLRNMVRSLLKYQRIETTLARAKEARRLAEKVITMGKSDTVFARRRAYDILADRDLVMKLFKETVPLFKDRQSGFTRIIPNGFRRGDGANLAILELTERKDVEKLPKKKEKTKAEEARPEKSARQVPEETKKFKEEDRRIKEPKIKTISKAKPSLEEEKTREKAKSEDRKAADKRGFMRNLRGLFRKRGDF